MSRTTLPLSQESIAPFDLEAFVTEAAKLNQRASGAFTLPRPKVPDRWLSHDQFQPRPLEFTASGEVEGCLSWLIGATIDLRFTRALFAPYDAKKVATATIQPALFPWRWPAGWMATPTGH